MLHRMRRYGSPPDHAGDLKLGFSKRTGDDVRLNVLPDVCTAKITWVLSHGSPVITYAIPASPGKKERAVEVTFVRARHLDRILLLLLLHLLQMQQMNRGRGRFLGALHQNGPVFRNWHIAVQGR